MNQSFSIKALFIAFFLCSVEVIHAESLDEEQARYAAAEFFSPSSQSARLRAKGRQLVLRSQGHDDGYYIFDRPEGGVVFVADDDAIGRTILGYTDSGSYDEEDLPIGLQDWLGQVTVLMDAVHEGKINKDNVRRKAGSIVVNPLIQTQWAQRVPYNNLCPISNGQRCVTGCVATAMAQVMKYWKWPEHGYGSVSYYDEEGCGQTLSRDLSSDYYDWDNMLNSYSNGYTDTQATAVATLLRDCGYAVQMKYTPSASSAHLSDCAIVLSDYFHYSAEAMKRSLNNYSEDTWHTFIHQDLKAGRPVLYRGEYEEAEAGHAFILDGYDTGGYYHVNWGWGGSQDGWFMLTNLNGYNDNQWMINNLKPDNDDSSSYITFADANVKAICVANWDTNGDGELSKAEAAAVTSLGNVFESNKNITSFNELQYFTGLTSIGGYTFFNCSGLTSVTIPNSVTSIGSSAFSGCSGLTSVTIPNSVTSIGERAFRGCSSLTSVTIPNSVTSIGSFAFGDCSGLTSVTIPNSVKSIGTGAFYGCSGLTSIKVETGNTKYDSRNNCNAIIETATNTLIAGCKNTLIPNSVTSIGGYAFYGCSGLTSVTIPNSVTSIGDWAFRNCI